LHDRQIEQTWNLNVQRLDELGKDLDINKLGIGMIKDLGVLEPVW
ncbi:13347_t:CDS:2, partial [Gigaspora margarita]